MGPDVIRAITIIAASQQGLVSVDQLRSLRLARAQIRTLVQRGQLRLEAPRVYVVAPAHRRRSSARSAPACSASDPVRC